MFETYFIFYRHFFKSKAKETKVSKANVRLDHVLTTSVRDSRAPTRFGFPPGVFPGYGSS